MRYPIKYPIDELYWQQLKYHENHDKSPYTWFKARLYMEFAHRIVFFLQNTDLSPNLLSFTYGLLGIVGGVLLTTNAKIPVLLGCLIFFFKGILDWADGHLARVKHKVSEEGKNLDYWAGRIGTIYFYLGFIYYFMSHNCFFLITLPFLRLAGKLDGRARTVDFLCLLIVLNEFLT